jgi:predicted MPP superfamily phosphohydrolase
MLRKIYLSAMILVVTLLICSYMNLNKPKAESKTQDNFVGMQIPDNKKDFIQKVYQEKISIPNLKKTYKFLYIADTHVIVKTRDDLGELFGNTDKRIDSFRNIKGKSSKEQFPIWIQFANENNVDALLMGGDIIDYFSDENINYIKENLFDLKAPYLYTMGNHDSCIPWDNLKNVSNNKNLLSLFRKEDTEVQVLDCGEFNIVSVNDSSGKISEKALSEFKEIYNIRKPIILILHIPLCTQSTEMLKEDTINHWKQSILLGDNCSYSLDNNTKEFINIVTDNNSRVAAILAGHLHFYHKDLLNSKTVQLVSDISSRGNGMMVTIQGDK